MDKDRGKARPLSRSRSSPIQTARAVGEVSRSSSRRWRSLRRRRHAATRSPHHRLTYRPTEVPRPSASLRLAGVRGLRRAPSTGCRSSRPTVRGPLRSRSRWPPMAPVRARQTSPSPAPRCRCGRRQPQDLRPRHLHLRRHLRRHLHRHLHRHLPPHLPPHPHPHPHPHRRPRLPRRRIAGSRSTPPASAPDCWAARSRSMSKPNRDARGARRARRRGSSSRLEVTGREMARCASWWLQTLAGRGTGR